MRRLIAFIALVLAIGVTALPVAAESVEDISKELMCQCGCTMIVYNCDCSTAGQMNDVIRTKLGEGQSKQQIIDYFVGQYGETVLSAPTKEGFNLTAWIFPFVALVIGAGIVYFVLTRWFIVRGQAEHVPVNVESIAGLDAYDERLREELKDFER
ncbi:MAG: cytochrome c-type biogenesis protein CcmH [Chloroflexi bacterium]|nr:cytochrome c-type biogenesis protein CcmH [Chloroflexota bacterium]MDA8187162.1 cytochrome c-type biogenesis protein CcmH [Dehalococcoidales bacterium]